MRRAIIFCHWNIFSSLSIRTMPERCESRRIMFSRTCPGSSSRAHHVKAMSVESLSKNNTSCKGFDAPWQNSSVVGVGHCRVAEATTHEMSLAWRNIPSIVSCRISACVCKVSGRNKKWLDPKSNPASSWISREPKTRKAWDRLEWDPKSL